MITQSNLKCPSCRLSFGFQNTPKMLKSCPHTICINCLKNVKCCPIDLVEINLKKWGLKSFLTNINILEEIQDEGSVSIRKREEIRFSFSGKKQQKSINNEQNKLFGQSLDNTNWRLCKTHLKRCDIINKQDLSTLCSFCISSKPLNSYISYQQLLKNLTHLTDNTYKIYQQLNTCSQKISKRKIEKLISSQLISKKEKQTFSIRNYFQNVIQQIRKYQRQLVERLGQIVEESQTKLKEKINVSAFRLKKQLWASKVRELTNVVEQFYDWKGFDRAMGYLDESCIQSRMISQGQQLVFEMVDVEERVRDIIQEETKTLECSFNANYGKMIEKLCVFKQQTNIINQNNNHKTVQTLIDKAVQYTPPKPFQITQTHSQAISLPIINIHQQFFYNSPHQPSPHHSYPPHSPSLSQQQQDFLLDSDKSSFRHNQTLTKNEITFEENFSLVENELTGRPEEFTPILRKEEDSMLGLQDDQSTIVNLKNVQSQKENITMLQRRSQDLTIQFKQTRKSISSSCQKIPTSRQKIPTSTYNQLSQTLIYPKQRSPLKSILNNNNNQSKQKKPDIPERYLTVWESAKNDKQQTSDLTGAQLGDTTILILCNYLQHSQKIRSLKLIRNKLTDRVIEQLINCISKTNISSLNLSQNSLTEKALDIIEQVDLGNLKSITLSLNKIVLRKVRERIEKFRERGITLTV